MGITLHYTTLQYSAGNAYSVSPFQPGPHWAVLEPHHLQGLEHYQDLRSSSLTTTTHTIWVGAPHSGDAQCITHCAQGENNLIMWNRTDLRYYCTVQYTTLQYCQYRTELRYCTVLWNRTDLRYCTDTTVQYSTVLPILPILPVQNWPHSTVTLTWS